MPSNKIYDYDSFEDDDDDLEDFKNLKLKPNIGHQIYKIDENNCTPRFPSLTRRHLFFLPTKADSPSNTRSTTMRYIDSHFKPPQRLYTYDYITGPWMKQLVFVGIGDRRAKSFLSEESLVNGSQHGGVATRWSQVQEFWEGVIEATGTRQLFFSGDSINELCNMLAEQVDQVPKANTKPNKDMSFSASRILEPKSLRAFRPVDVEDLRSNLHSMKSNLFSVILTQSRKAYAELYTRGGTIFTLKTQRYELDPQIVTEIGWSYTSPGSNQTDSGDDDVVKHRGKPGYLAAVHMPVHGLTTEVTVVHENRMYRNGAKIPDQQDFFGFPDPVTKEGTQLIHESAIKEEIGDTIDRHSLTGPVLLVLHGADIELSYLREYLSPGIDKWKAEMPGDLFVKDKESRHSVIIQDTQRLYAAFKSEPEHASTVLHTACVNENIPCHKILNAAHRDISSKAIQKLLFSTIESL